MLLVLRRIGDVETHPDEKAILGDWHVVKIAADRVREGYTVPEDDYLSARARREERPSPSGCRTRRSVTLDESTLCLLHRIRLTRPMTGGPPADERTRVSLPYGIDPTTKPATIDISTVRLYLTNVSPNQSPPPVAIFGLVGISRLDGERLTLRLALAAPEEGGYGRRPTPPRLRGGTRRGPVRDRACRADPTEAGGPGWGSSRRTVLISGSRRLAR